MWSDDYRLIILPKISIEAILMLAKAPSPAGVGIAFCSVNNANFNRNEVY